jgi:hypothetical protein
MQKSPTLFLFSILFSVSINSQNIDLDDFYLDSTSVIIRNSENLSSSGTKYYYDEEFKLILEDDGDGGWHHEYTYYNNKITQTDFDPNNEPSTRKIATYNDDGLLIMYEYFNLHDALPGLLYVDSLSYNDHNQLTQKYKTRTNSSGPYHSEIILNEYDEMNRLSTRYYYKTINSGSVLFDHTLEYFYDEKDRLIRIVKNTHRDINFYQIVSEWFYSESTLDSTNVSTYFNDGTVSVESEFYEYFEDYYAVNRYNKTIINSVLEIGDVYQVEERYPGNSLFYPYRLERQFNRNFAGNILFNSQTLYTDILSEDGNQFTYVEAENDVISGLHAKTYIYKRKAPFEEIEKDSGDENHTVLFPNPVSVSMPLKMKSNQEIDHILLFDNMGKLVIKLEEIGTMFSAPDVPGLYFLQIHFKEVELDPEIHKIIVAN